LTCAARLSAPKAISALRPRQSLVLLYAKDVPLVEERMPGERYLIGAGLVDSIDPAVEWTYSKEGPLRSIMWERGVAHSIRPSFDDGFLLPYVEAKEFASVQHPVDEVDDGDASLLQCSLNGPMRVLVEAGGRNQHRPPR
jgi:hypothetical protein